MEFDELNEIPALDKLMNITARKAIDTFGIKTQLIKMVEELNELGAVMLHYLVRRNITYNEIKYDLLQDDVIDEMVDVCIMFRQFDQILLKFTEDDPEFARTYNEKIIKSTKFKINRLMKMVDNS
jgi:hypothetical protein